MLKMKDTVSVTLNYEGSVYTFYLNLKEVDECRQSKIQNTTSCRKLIKKVDQKNEMVSKVMAEWKGVGRGTMEHKVSSDLVQKCVCCKWFTVLGHLVRLPSWSKCRFGSDQAPITHELVTAPQ